MSSSHRQIAPAATLVSFPSARRSRTSRRTGAATRRSRRRRTATAAWLRVIALGLLLAVLVICMVAARTPDARIGRTTTVRVAKGDSLWALARAHRVPGADTARTVEIIKALNDLETGTLLVGSTLRVPSQPRPNVASR